MKLKKWHKLVFVCIIIIILSVYFNINEFVLIMLFGIGYSIYKIYKGRGLIMQNMRIIETMIFKKPLDKNMWEKGELKNIKIKFRWRKKKDEEIAK